MQIKDLKFDRTFPFESDVMYSACIFLPTNYGFKRTRITVLDRMTGFGHRDIETGFRDINGQFWLASGDFDIREFPLLGIDDAIRKIKENANNCRGSIVNKCFDIKTRQEIGR